MKSTTKSITDRFWEKVDKTGNYCWIWTAGVSSNGYGVFHPTHNKHIGSHRIAWEQTNGPIPKGLCVLHKCDNPLCVNPDHLFLGTRGDNNRDKASKGRCQDQTGEKNPSNKLTKEEVGQIRALYRWFTQYELAAMFETSQPNISQILNNNRWGG